MNMGGNVNGVLRVLVNGGKSIFGRKPEATHKTVTVRIRSIPDNPLAPLTEDEIMDGWIATYERYNDRR
jgi:hypothetical protein